LLVVLGARPFTLNVLLPERAVTELVPLVPEPQAVNRTPLSEQLNVSDVGADHPKSAAVAAVVLGGVNVKTGDGDRGGGAAEAEPASGPAKANVATTDDNAAAAVSRSGRMVRIRDSPVRGGLMWRSSAETLASKRTDCSYTDETARMYEPFKPFGPCTSWSERTTSDGDARHRVTRVTESQNLGGSR
jgi:hypothetical protein